MATREQKIDFIYKNFKFKGGMTKKQLRNYSDEAIDNFIARYPDKFNEYINRPKTIKYLWCNDTHSGEVHAVDISAAKDELLKNKIIPTQIETSRGHHFCRYCGGIADGSDKDVLCLECRTTFGHWNYNEL